MLRDSIRGYLQKNWPNLGAIERSEEKGQVAVLWQGFVKQGLATLGSNVTEGGWREIAVVMEELGRAACPAPMMGAALANLLLARAGTTGEVSDALIRNLHSGEVKIAVSHTEPVPNLRLGGIIIEHESANGTIHFIDGLLDATHLMVVAHSPEGEPRLVFIDVNSSGVQILPTRAMGLSGDAGWAEVRLKNASAQSIAVPEQALLELKHGFRIMLLARAFGAARRSFEMVVDYAKERKQFGKPIGQFQAIQHKLADNLISLEGCRLTLAKAAESLDFKLADWEYFTSASIAFAGQTLRQVVMQNQHAFGAIGYAEEHEAPRHFRRVHLDLLVMGGTGNARKDLASYLLDEEDASLPLYDLGEAGNSFRTEVMEWLKVNWNGDRKSAFDCLPFHDREYDPSFALDLGKTGWIGQGWSPEYGGQGRTPREQLAFLEVMERAETPRAGASVQANALMMHGTHQQKAYYLPEILEGKAMHGMGYSEPDAGSDLASLRTTAVKDGEEWVINGQKIWTTTWWGKYMFLAARTDLNANPQHAGISMFIVPMNTPGISITPATTMYDGSFANIFYDNVRIPLDNIVGKVNGGWKVLTDALANERGVIGGGIVLKVAHAFNLLLQDIRANAHISQDSVVRDKVGQLAAEIEVGRQLMIHCAELAESGNTPAEMGAISKVYSGELMERFGETVLDILGPVAALSQNASGALRNGRYEQNLRHSLMWVISIGTNEIQRSLIAQRGLGLPR